MDPFGMIAQAGADLGLGMITRGINNRDQLQQQGKLNEQQFAIDGRALARQKAAELQQWKDTSYGAQLDEMKRNNLSPGMMYGAAGGGAGQLGGSTGSVNAPKAATPGNEVLGMTVAQRQLIEAQTENVKADTAKKKGVDTDLTREQGRMTHIAANLAAHTQQEAEQIMWAQAKKLTEEAKAAGNMVDAELKKKQADAIGAFIMNEIRWVEKDKTEAELKAIGETVAQKWKALEIQQGHLDIQKFVQDVSNSTKLTVETVTKLAQMVGGGVIKGIPNKTIKTHELGKSTKIE